MKLEITNLAGYAVDKKLFTAVAKKILMGENKGTQRVSLVFVKKPEMQKLNKQYRGKNKPTDVLSFELKDKVCFGEIVICPAVVKEKKEEMLEVFIHGMLHILGYDHIKDKDAEAMEEKEKHYHIKIRSTKSEIRNKFKIPKSKK